MKLRKRLIMSLCFATLLCVAGCGAGDSDNALGTNDSVSTAVTTQEDTTEAKTTEAATATTEKKTEEKKNSDKNKPKDEASSTEAINKIKASSYVGKWAEEHAHRGIISISEAGNGKYNVEVSWSGSAFEKNMWSMTAEFNEDTDRLEYSECTMTYRKYSDEDNYTDNVEYTDGSGNIFFADSKLGWVSSKADIDGIDGSSFFVSYDSFENEPAKPDNDQATTKSEEPTTEETPNVDDEISKNIEEEENDGNNNDTQEPVFTGTPYVGVYKYQGETASEGTLKVTYSGGIYYVTINVIVTPNVEEYSVSFSGEFSGKGILRYNNAIKYHTYYDENHIADEVEDYSDGTGQIQMGDPDGDSYSMNWNDVTANIGEAFYRSK